MKESARYFLKPMLEETMLSSYRVFQQQQVLDNFPLFFAIALNDEASDTETLVLLDILGYFF